MKKLTLLLSLVTLTAFLAPGALAEDAPACSADPAPGTAASPTRAADEPSTAAPGDMEAAATTTACVPTEEHEVSCDDGLDNDCDGLTDFDDFDCQIVCIETHCCGLFDCCPQSAPCTTDSDCCSNRCRGGVGKKKCI